MKISNISLPYPVLGIQDDIRPELPDDCITICFDEDKSSHTFRFRIDLKFDNSKIEKLLAEGKAEYSCEYECPRSMLRVCLKSSKPHFDFNIPNEYIAGRLNISCFVSVKALIPNYTNIGFHEDYSNCSFYLEPGDILVAFPAYTYDADIDYDKLQSVGAFMQIRSSEDRKDVFFDLSGDRIMIVLPQRLFNLWNNPCVSRSETATTFLALNALTYALVNIEKYDDTLWARTIKYRLETEPEFQGYDLDEDILSIAQAFLKDPYSRLFNKIINDSQ